MELTPLAWRPQEKYLGVHFAQRLTWQEHVEVTKMKFQNARNVLLPLLRPWRPLRMRIKILIYTAMLRPMLL